MNPPTFSVASDIATIPRHEWNALTHDNPFLSHAFLQALEQTGCACDKTGWSARHLLMHRDGLLVGAMPLYLKHHSRGEYVFDMGWARAFEQHGLPYYPKLLSAIPFTPVPGPRLLVRNTHDKPALAQAARQLCQDNAISSLHVLFPDEADTQVLGQNGYMMRRNVQFHWFNKGYPDVQAFLADLTQVKRKKLRQDSRKVSEAGVTFQVHTGDELTAERLDFFYRCYTQTYLEHGNLPYLTLPFFQRLVNTMAANIVLITAWQHGQAVASALNIRSATRLYGRYWGSLQFIPGLHFETCYMQGIAYCIREGLQVFEGGAQGEHKLSRGMLPVETWSAHYVAHTGFAKAIESFLSEETAAVSSYQQELQEHSPFRQL
jgi:hypothetical protein